MRVLIFGGRAPVALDHARRFAAQGWQAYIADSMPARLSGWSNFVSGTFRLPSPRDALHAFAAELSRIIAAERIDLVLPTCEEVFYISRIRHRLPATCNVFVAPFPLLRDLHSKWTFLELARDCGVDVPESVRVDDLAAAREWAHGRPVVIKPEFSRFGVHVRVHPDGIPTDATPLPAAGPWVVQAFQRGAEICSYSIVVAGKLRAHVAYHPRYRLAGSSSYYFDPVVMPRIADFVERFAARLGFTGQLSFDWIDGGDGRLAVLECNPRAISGLHLFTRSDPLPAAIVGESDACISPVAPAARMLGPMMLGLGLPTALRRRTLATWYRDWSRATDALSAPGDVRPVLGGGADMVSLVRVAMQKRCDLRAASTRDIEWDGEPLPE